MQNIFLIPVTQCVHLILWTNSAKFFFHNELEVCNMNQDVKWLDNKM